MNERQCEWGEGWDAAQAHFEKRLDTMAEEYEALLQDARDSDNRAASTIVMLHERIQRLEARSGIYERMVEDIKELIG